MAISIPKRVTDVADINVTTHIKRMSSAQQTTFKRVLRDGVGTNGGLPSTLAILARKAQGLPTIHFDGRELSWWGHNDPSDVFFEKLRAFQGAYALYLSGAGRHRTRYLDESVQQLEHYIAMRASHGAVWVGECKDAPLIFGKMKLKRWEGGEVANITVDGDTAARL